MFWFIITIELLEVPSKNNKVPNVTRWPSLHYALFQVLVEYQLPLSLDGFIHYTLAYHLEV